LEGVNARDRAAEFARVMKSVPKEFQQKAVAEMMAADKRIGMEYMIAAVTTDPRTQESLISNGVQEKAIGEALEAKIPGGKNTIESAVASDPNVNGIMAALNRSGQFGMSALMMKQVQLEAMKTTAQTGDIDQAVKDASAKIVKDNFHIIDEPGAQIIAPKSKVSSKVVDAFLHDSLSDRNVAKMGLTKSRYMFNDTDENWGKYLRDKAHWKTNDSLDSVALHMEFKGVIAPMKDSEGKIISVKFDDMQAQIDSRIATNISVGMPKEQSTRRAKAIDMVREYTMALSANAEQFKRKDGQGHPTSQQEAYDIDPEEIKQELRDYFKSIKVEGGYRKGGAHPYFNPDAPEFDDTLIERIQKFSRRNDPKRK
jgi:hypothetical protein